MDGLLKMARRHYPPSLFLSQAQSHALPARPRLQILISFLLSALGAFAAYSRADGVWGTAGGAGFRRHPDVIRPWGRPTARMDASRAAAAPAGGGRPWGDGGGGGRAAEDDEGGEVSLREWLDRPGRAVEAPECSHVFRQVAEAVPVAHAQGVAVGSARPSCFVVSPPFARVAFIESASGSDASGSDASEEDGADHNDANDQDAQPPRRPNKNGAAQARDGQHKGFPLKSVLAMELNWYTRPTPASVRSCAPPPPDRHRGRARHPGERQCGKRRRGGAAPPFGGGRRR
nr:uncharacterized protein LOC127335168 [Lolium perenne]